MKYFRVERQQIVGNIVQGEVFSDGEFINLPDDIEPNETRDLGYVVYIMDEMGRTLDIVYGYTDIEQIKEDFPALEWQNNDW